LAELGVCPSNSFPHKSKSRGDDVYLHNREHHEGAQ